MAISNENKKILDTDFEPSIILAGKKADLLGLVEPVHMCSNCWNNKISIHGGEVPPPPPPEK